MSYKGIRVEYAGIGFISAFNKVLFNNAIDKIPGKTAAEAEDAFDELMSALPVPRCLTGETGLVSYFTEAGYKKFKPFIEKMVPAFKEISATNESNEQNLKVINAEFDDKKIVYSDKHQFLVQGVFDKKLGLWVAPQTKEAV